MSGLSASQLAALVGNLNPGRVKHRKQGGANLSYVEAWEIKTSLIRMFGFGGFSADVIDSRVVTIREGEKKPDGSDKTPQAICQATVRLTVYGIGPSGQDVTYTETAIGSNSGRDIGDILDNAIKGLAVDTPIPTPSGWSTMGDLKVGDVVFDMTGRQVRVTQKSAVKNIPCYRLTFGNGEQLVCDEEHRWIVRDNRIGRNDTANAVVDVQELYARRMAGERVTIPVARELDTDEANLPVDPWTLGYWLGNGDTRCGRVTCHVDDVDDLLPLFSGEPGRIQSCDGSLARTFQIVRVPSLVRAVDERNSMIHECTSAGMTRQATAVEMGVSKATVDRVLAGQKLDQRTGLTTALKNAGLLGHKVVPGEYLRASFDQRLELLRGLMDSDGSVGGGRPVFTSTSPFLAYAVCELVRSLGDQATCQEYEATGYGKTVTAYRVTWTATVMPFHLKRKADKVSMRQRRGYNRVVSVEKIDPVPTQCIAVDSPSRSYLAGSGFIPTHNTAESDALKRAATYLGTQFGLSLYNDGSLNDVVRQVLAPEQDAKLQDFYEQRRQEFEAQKEATAAKLAEATRQAKGPTQDNMINDEKECGDA